MYFGHPGLFAWCWMVLLMSVLDLPMGDLVQEAHLSMFFFKKDAQRVPYISIKKHSS